MRAKSFHRSQLKPTLVVSIGFFVLCAALMGYLRLYVFGDRFISLAWGLPLLFCLAYPDRRLLWSLAVTLIAMGGAKALFILPEPYRTESLATLQWTMQVLNIVVIAGAVHLLLRFVDGLRALPALILLDLNLPGLSGFEVLEWVRQQPSFQTLTVVIFSSSGRPEDRNRARELGATDYLMKPNSGQHFAEIARRVQSAWLETPPARSANP